MILSSRRLAAAGRAEQRDEFSIPDMQGEILQYLFSVKCDGDVFQVDDVPVFVFHKNASPFAVYTARSDGTKFLVDGAPSHERSNRSLMTTPSAKGFSQSSPSAKKRAKGTAALLLMPLSVFCSRCIAGREIFPPGRQQNILYEVIAKKSRFFPKFF